MYRVVRVGDFSYYFGLLACRLFNVDGRYKKRNCMIFFLVFYLCSSCYFEVS
jgi:hypothetical protein